MQLGKVMVVDDSDALRALMVSSLIRHGIDVYSASDLEKARKALESFKPDVVVLDLELGEDDGNDLIDEIDAAGAICLVASSRDKVEDRIKSLSLGAEDYMVKPIDMQELFLRIRNLLNLRRSTTVDIKNAIAELGGVKVDLVSRRLIGKDSKRHDDLTMSEFELLRLLAEKPGAVQSREMLFRRVMGRNVSDSSRALDMLVSKVRKKLRSAGCKVDINSVRGEGYALRPYRTSTIR